MLAARSRWWEGVEPGKLVFVAILAAAGLGLQAAVLELAVAAPLAKAMAAQRDPPSRAPRPVRAVRPHFEEEIVVRPPPGWKRSAARAALRAPWRPDAELEGDPSLADAAVSLAYCPTWRGGDRGPSAEAPSARRDRGPGLHAAWPAAPGGPCRSRIRAPEGRGPLA